MSLQVVVEGCDEAIWRSSRARRGQIRALKRMAHSPWSKGEVAHWRDCAELGWGEGRMMLAEQLQWPYIPVPNFKAINRTRKMPSDRPIPAWLVGKAVGAAMAAMFADMDADWDDIETKIEVFRLTDPDTFASRCCELLDDGAMRTATGAPNLDDIGVESFQARDAVWASAWDWVQSAASESLDLSSNRSRYAPI